MREVPDPIQPDEPHRTPPLRTRTAPPKPRRLSRKAIAILAGGSMIAVAAAVAYSFNSARADSDPTTSVSVERRQSDLLASAPKDYSDLAARDAQGIGPPAATPPTAAPPDPQTPATDNAPSAQSSAAAAEQRSRQQAESARGSRLFADAGAVIRRNSEPGAETAPESSPAKGDPPGKASSQQGDGIAPSSTARIIAAPRSTNVLAAGSTIAAALITGLSSDLPGEVVAQVTEDVFDTRSGEHRLIPQGSRLIGTYDAKVSFGQTRARVVWTRLLFPDGRSIDLDRLVGTDAAGQSGFADRVNDHWGLMVKAGLISTLLGIGSSIAELGENGEIANAIRDSAGQTIGRAGDRIVERQLGVQPTITIRPGARVRVLVSRDLVLDPPSAD